MTERKKAGISAVWGSLALALMVAGCGLTPSGRKPAQATEPSVVPAPLRLEAKPGTFALRPETRIVIVESQVEALPVATFLRDILKTPTGYDLGIEVSTEYAGETPLRAGAIYLRLADLEGRLGQEGYLLDVGPDRILMEAAAPAGLFYGVQTLRQLLPAAIEKPAPEAGRAPGRSPRSRSRTGPGSAGAAACSTAPATSSPRSSSSAGSTSWPCTS